MIRIWIIVLLAMGLNPAWGAEEPAESGQRPFTPTSGYTRQEIEGFPVLVHNTLLQGHAELAEQVLALARCQLFLVSRAVPAGPLAKLRTVKIWIEYDNPDCKGACHHPSREWLVAHNYNPDKEDSVEIGNARNFLAWSRQQPWMIMHELAHAWHHQFLGNDQPAIKAAWRAARDSGRYDSVLHIGGTQQKAYAMNNEMEYFAESTEAFFGANDFYPFVRAELKEFDPEMHGLLERLWEVTPSRP